MARRSTERAPTLEMVAREAGVSRATVSRVVNGSPTVGAEAAEAVHRAIDRLRYVPNRAARSLASRSSNAIALIIPEDVIVFFTDPFFAAIVKGITDRIDQSSYVLNLLVSSSDPQHKTRTFLESGAVDGAIVTSHHVGDDLLGDRVSIPVVYGGRPMVTTVDPYFVDVDNVSAAATATRHLMTVGRRKLGTITGPTDMQASIDRLQGFQEAIAQAGLPAGLVEHGDFTAASGAAAMRRLLERVEPADIDGLFIASDLMATGALAVLAEAGIRVPEDIAIVGFDDSPAAASAAVPLTTMTQPSERQGWLMADVLIRVLSGEAGVPQQTILNTDLVIRESA